MAGHRAPRRRGCIDSSDAKAGNETEGKDVMQKRLSKAAALFPARPLEPNASSRPLALRARPITRCRWLALGLLSGVLCLLGSPVCLRSSAQFALDWWTVDGGGGSSTGGVYAVTGTIGQPDAARLTGGPFVLTGGFWAVAAAVQTPGAPTLYITNAAPGWVVIWWTPPSPEFVLQVSPTLSPPTWTNAPSGSTNPVLVRTVWPLSFFRLRKP